MNMTGDMAGALGVAVVILVVVAGGCKAKIDDRCMEACSMGDFVNPAWCGNFCEAARDLASEAGCVEEHQAVWDCFATEGTDSNRCDDQGDALFACTDRARPTDCTRYCHECTHFACPYTCPIGEAVAKLSGCEAEYRRADECRAANLPDDCGWWSCGSGELEACNACQEAYCAAHPEDC